MRFKNLLVLVITISLIACSARRGPDKTIAGAILGAGWGAGAGAAVGNQVNNTGPGAAVGAGIGAASGMISGAGFDIAESDHLDTQQELDALKVQLAANQRRIVGLQQTLDNRDENLRKTAFSSARVFFDNEKASIRSGAAKELQVVAEHIKRNPYVGRVQIHGHSDQLDTDERGMFLSEARSRSVATFLAHQGVSLDQMDLFAYGASRPIATNDTEVGRQLNRRVEIVLVK